MIIKTVEIFIIKVEKINVTGGLSPCHICHILGRDMVTVVPSP